ncbi:DUF5687 family protein [Mucilaginibacter sp. SG564]|uniref:DUF5687 family protein n=1 Tax=unclassified Mucilaginibacter TaxID=2617802 RepID=UPI001551BFC4|nr:DUF5687 family protein [Mucilaginibacter sp. SG564]NOW94466.1 hypothetical protein [Mucilaginibacter sp. SG564]
MISTFIRHELKAFWRSKNTGKSIAVRIVMIFLILYLFGCILLAGIGMDKILEIAFPNDDLVKSFCGIVLIYFLFDLFMRLQLQELPTLRVQPYLHLPIKRNTLVGYLAITAVFSMFNLWPFLLFLPFIFKIIAPDSGIIVALAFVVAIIGISVFNNYLALYLKRKSNLNGWIFLITAAVLILIVIADFWWHFYSLHNISYAFFGRLLTMPILAIIPALLGIVMYYFNFLYLKQNLYLETLTARKVKIYKSNTDIPFLSRFGTIGDLAANEIKLVFRNKRSRSSLIIGLFFMFYGLIFYTNKSLGQGWYLFAGMYMTGAFVVNYGQFMFGWQASHFDGILVSKINFSDFVKAKYLLFTTVSAISFVLTIPYVYFGWHVLLVHFVMCVWNIGVTTTIVLFFANRNFKRIDLSKSGTMNWEGVGASQLLLTLPLILTPYIIYTPFAVFKHPDIGLALLAVTGFIAILTRNYWIKQLEADYYSKRYRIAEGFRNK